MCVQSVCVRGSGGVCVGGRGGCGAAAGATTFFTPTQAGGRRQEKINDKAERLSTHTRQGAFKEALGSCLGGGKMAKAVR